MGTAGRRKRGRQTENCSLIYYTRRGKKISLAPSSHMEWGHTRTHGISLHLCTQGVRAARHTQESHGGSASPRERAREGGSPNNITTIHEEFTCRQKSRHRRTRGTTRDAHTTGLLLRRLASHVPHITTNRRWERKNEEKKKKRMTTVHGNRKSVVVPQPHLCCCCPVYFSSPHRDFSSSSQRARRATHNTIRTVRAHAHTRGMLRATCCARRGSPPHSGRCPHVLGGP